MKKENDCSRFPKILMRYGNRMHRIDVVDKNGHCIEVSVWVLDSEVFLMKRTDGGVNICEKIGMRM